MKPKAKAICWSCIGFLYLLVGPIANAGTIFEGNRLNVQHLFQETPSSDDPGEIVTGVVVGPDVELQGFGQWGAVPNRQPGYVDIDIADTRITITLIRDQPSNFGSAFRFINSFNEIPNIVGREINPATTWTGFNQLTRIQVTGGNVNINVSGLSGLAGQKIVADFIPEPSGATLALFGLAGLAARRRRLHA